jgi:glycosyltransferase involved in cell wall biosynthesis
VEVTLVDRPERLRMSGIRPLLSLCIPTYNRGPFLGSLLDTIAATLPVGEQQIEILVSDNASADDTTSVVELAQAKLPQLRYLRNASNIGAVPNILSLMDASCGKYVWLFGDDDVFLPGGLAAVLAAVSEDPDYIVLNFSLMNRDGSSRAIRRYHSIRGDRPLRSHDEVMALFGMSLGLIDSVVFRREKLFSISRADYLRHAESGLSPLYAALHVASKGSIGRYVSQAVFDYRSDNSDHAPTPEQWTKVYGHDTRALLNEMRTKGYSVAACRLFCRDMIWKFYLPIILGNRIQGKDTVGYYRSLWRDYRDIPLAWGAMLTMLIPSSGARAIRSTWRYMWRRRG